MSLYSHSCYLVPGHHHACTWEKEKNLQEKKQVPTLYPLHPNLYTTARVIVPKCVCARRCPPAFPPNNSVGSSHLRPEDEIISMTQETHGDLSPADL